MKKQPFIIAHRGASGTTPENTLAAFRRALEIRADMIELDVQLTRDRQLVVIHDSILDRTTNGRGSIADFTLAELKQWDAGSWFGGKFAGETIPALNEVLELINCKIPLNIEVKVPDCGNRPEYIHSTAAILAKMLISTGKPDSFIISSFDYDFLKELHRIQSKLQLAYLFHFMVPDWKKKLSDGLLSAIHPNWLITTEKLVKTAHQSGITVNVWTVDEIPKMIRLAQLGVDGIITNYPERWIYQKITILNS